MSTGEYRTTNLSALTDELTELQLPLRPLLVTDLFPVSLPDGGLHLVGAEPKTIHGASLRWMLHTLFPLLDGTRTVPALCATLPNVSASDLRDVLSLLNVHGLIEEGDDPGTEEEREALRAGFASPMAFFSRYLRLTGRHANRYEVQRTLGAATVGVIATPEHGALMRSLLEPGGLAQIIMIDISTFTEGALPRVELVVVLADVATQVRLAPRLRTAAALYIDPEACTIGPLTVFGHSACPTCVQLWVEPPASVVVAQSAVTGRERELWLRALLGRAAQHVIAYVTGLYQSQALEHVERWDPVTRTTSLLAFVPWFPNCPTCGERRPPLTLTLPSGHRENHALYVHCNALLKPWHLEQRSAIRMHLTQEVSEQLRHARLQPRPIAAGEAAPPLYSSASATRSSASALRLEPLLQLLTLSFGGRIEPMEDGGHQFQRYTASAGNLGSAEPYLVVAEVEGLEPGVHHYDAVDGTLDAVRHGPVDALLGGVRSHEGIGAALVIVSAVGRLCAKYDARGYVYSLLDAGLMAHRVSMLASTLQMQAVLQLELDDEAWCRGLGIDGLELAPVAVVTLRPCPP